jgi:hypothetical protein
MRPCSSADISIWNGNKKKIKESVKSVIRHLNIVKDKIEGTTVIKYYVVTKSQNDTQVRAYRLDDKMFGTA